MFVVAVIGKKKKKKVWRDDEFWKITTAAEVLQVGPFKPPELAISFHTSGEGKTDDLVGCLQTQIEW